MFKKKLNLRPELLPEGWEAKQKGGKIVYVNHITKQTQWEKPTMPNSTGHDGLNDTNVEPSAAPSARYVAKVDGPSRSSSSRQREERPCAAKADGPARKSSNRKREELPYGWRKAKTKDGETLYVNDIEKITSWDRPVPIAAPAVPPQHGSEGDVTKGRRPSTHSNTSTASNSAADSRSSSRDYHEESRRARRRPSTDDASIGIGSSSQGLREKKTSSSSSRHRSSRSSGSGTRDDRHEEPDSPLPQGWSMDYSKSGRPFYRNNHDETITTWDKPTETCTRRTGLPEGWSMAFTESGKPFYLNDYDQTTTWDKPTEASIGAASASSRNRSSSSSKSKEREQSRLAKSGSREHPSEASNRRAATSSRKGDSSRSGGGSGSGSGGSSRDGNDRLTKASPRAANLAPGSPLPAGWSKAITDNGETYYRNDHDQTTTWDRPTRASNGPAVASDGSRGKIKGQEKCRPSKSSSSGEHQEQPLPPGWSQDITADGQTYYRNHNDQTTSWDRPAVAPANPRNDAARPKASRRQSASSLREGPPPPLPARNARRSSASDLHAQQQQAAAAAPAPAPAPAVFDPTMFGMPPGTQLPPQLQQAMMQQKQQAMMQGQQQPGQPTGVPMGIPGMFGGPPPTTVMGKGMNLLMKRMTEPPSVKPPPKGYVGLDGGSFTNFGGLNASALRAPKPQKERKPKKEEPSSLGDKAGNFFVNGLNKGINSGLGAVGAGDLYKVNLKKKKRGGLKWGGKVKLPGLGSDSGSNSESGGDEEGGIEVDVDIDIEPEEEEEEEEEDEEEED